MASENFKETLEELREVINTIISRKLDFNLTPLEKNSNFKNKEREYYQKQILQALRKVKNAISDGFVIGSKEQKSQLSKIITDIKELEKQIDSKNFSEALNVILAMEENAPAMNVEIISEEKFYLPHVPKEIFPEIKANFDELQKCFENHCYRSCIILCGKILEVALHTKYYQVAKIDLLEKSPDIGLGNLIAKLDEKGYEADPGLMQQIHLINQLRVFSVHKKKQVFTPSQAQCQATILYTLDSIKKLFKDDKA